MYLFITFFILLLAYEIYMYIKEGIELKQMKLQMEMEELEESEDDYPELTIDSFSVAGISFYKNNIIKILDMNAPSDSDYVYDSREDYVLLIHEPNNKYDSNAIAVYMDGQKIGHVPKDINKQLLPFIQKKWFVGTITNGDMYSDDGIIDRNFSCKVRVENDR